jgi:superfamily I DNA and RNA helicase
VVIFANPVSVTTDAGPLVAQLRSRGIGSHIAGVTRGPNEFFVQNSVVISGIYRAKGNEAPMVYVLGAEYCYEGWGLIRRRNILFTAMTRSKAWVRVCGVGKGMDQLSQEWAKVQKNNYQLTFSVPTPEQLEKLRRIHRDRTEDEIQRVEDSRRSLADIVEMIEREEMTLEDLPKSLRQKLTKLLGGK